MARLAVYDSNDSIVPGRVTQYIQKGASRETYRSQGKEFLDTPDLTAVNGVPEYYWKVSNGQLVSMTEQDKDTYHKKTRSGIYTTKDKMQILSEINGELTVERRIAITTSPFFAGFVTVLEDASYTNARGYLAMALSAGDITQIEHDMMGSKMPIEPEV